MLKFLAGWKGYAVLAALLVAAITAAGVQSVRVSSAHETIAARDSTIATAQDKIRDLTDVNKRCAADVAAVRDGWAAYRAAEAKRNEEVAVALKAAQTTAEAARNTARWIRDQMPAGADVCQSAQDLGDAYLKRRRGTP